MSITEKDRLLSLVEFTRQSMLLRSKTTASVDAHGFFALYEHEITQLPGISTNSSSSDDNDEIWLTVERLHETRPPDIRPTELFPWVQGTQNPNDEPSLRQAIDRASLIASDRQHAPGILQAENGAVNDTEELVALSDYDKAAQVRAQFAAYLDTEWRPWAEEVKLCRKTIGLYSKLFSLKQQLEDGFVDAPLELVWGVGVAVWKSGETEVRYPLVGRLVEVLLNSKTFAMEIRPRDVEARIEVDWFASVDNPGVGELEKRAKEFFENATVTFSPFDPGTFEPILRSAVSNLDANGIYWPDEAPEVRSLPRPNGNLRVTDTWVLFARPRTNNVFLQDLEKLKGAVEQADGLPPAIKAAVTEPDTANPVISLPSFRGVSASNHAGCGDGGQKARDLYFPKPFNDEQVRIIQLLEVSEGVVVQGPPGTGKTHTIANVICHYLAEGKRVLVTSMKAPALAVLREHLPAEIRPLAIALLSSEQEGMKQFEHAIDKIASEIQSLDRTSTKRDIDDLEESIDAFHAKLAGIDRYVGEWATKSLATVVLENEKIYPQDAAREVVSNAGDYEWIPDALGTTSAFTPQFSDADVVRLREARRALGKDIDYLDASLPQPGEFPDSGALLEVHQDLSQFEKLKQEVECGDVLALADASHETLTHAQVLLGDVESLKQLRADVEQADQPWTAAMRQQLRSGGNDDVLQMLEALGVDLEEACEKRKAFLARPVEVPEGTELDVELVAAVGNHARGKKPFGLKGVFGMSEQKKRLERIAVLGQPPADAEGWTHVAGYLVLLKDLRQLSLRWNVLAQELQLETVPDDKPDGCLAAVQCYRLYRKVRDMVCAENLVCAAAAQIFPAWPHTSEVAVAPKRLADLEMALRHHLTKNRLARVWAAKERCQKVLEGRSGRVTDEIRGFLGAVLGNPAVTDAEMQAKWTALLAELSRVLNLRSHLDAVRDVSGKIDASGAPQYAASLKQPLEGVVDRLLPDHWRKAWRLRRLATYLESVDEQDDLRQLSKSRHEVEKDLSCAYRDLVVKRTWLKLAENASPRIKAALEAYRAAIKHIGKGGGKRAVRYRKDARLAASEANPAVPCWIMAHDRVSESLPADMGCFDLVIIDEASQSDLSALPSLMRARKVLIVGDDKQVSPDGVGVEEKQVLSLMDRFLSDQVSTYRAQMSPERSIYDLLKVVFAKNAVMLKEHFRCVGPIIEYSKREFYNHELRPLRVPKASERLDPPLVDVLVSDGFRTGKVNKPEARFIVDEIQKIVDDPQMASRSIGVVSLLGAEQTSMIWNMLTEELKMEDIQTHRIACGDARTFQGNERDIMFLSMVAAPKTDVLVRDGCHTDKVNINAPLTRDTFAQRFNVAASRARDRMYLVRSVDAGDLSPKDRLRVNLIKHFAAPFAQDESRTEDLRQRCESGFERALYDRLTERGYWVTPQVHVGHYRIDLVVEGCNDERLAIECDGDRYHGPDKWVEDMQRQRVLERAGWVFWRCFASTFIRREEEMLEDLFKTLAERGIEPHGAEGAPKSVHMEHRTVTVLEQPNCETCIAGGDVAEEDELPSLVPLWSSGESAGCGVPSVALSPPSDRRGGRDGGGAKSAWGGLRDGGVPLAPYREFSGPAGRDPRYAMLSEVSEGMVQIAAVEGPMLAKRVCDVYLRGCNVKRMGREIRESMVAALGYAIKSGLLLSEDEAAMGSRLSLVVRVPECSPIKLRHKGPRTFEEIPPSERMALATDLARRYGFHPGSDEHLRAILDCLGLKRLTTQVREILLTDLSRSYDYIDDFLSNLDKHVSS